MCVNNNNMSAANTNATKRPVNQGSSNNDETNKKQRTSSVAAPAAATFQHDASLDSDKEERAKEEEKAKDAFGKLSEVKGGESYITVDQFGDLFESMGSTYCEEEHKKSLKRLKKDTNRIYQSDFLVWYIDWLFGDEDSSDDEVEAQQQPVGPDVPSDTHVVVGVTSRGYHCKVCQKKGGYEQCHHNHKIHDLVDANSGTTTPMTELIDEITRLEQEISTMEENQQQQQQQGVNTTTSINENRNNPFASTNSTMGNIRVNRHGLARGYVNIDNFSNTVAPSTRSSSSLTAGSTSVEDPDDSLLCNLMEKCGLE